MNSNHNKINNDKNRTLTQLFVILRPSIDGMITFFFIFLVQIMNQSHAANNNTYTQSQKDQKYDLQLGVHWWCLNIK